jgi:hypothetical protein
MASHFMTDPDLADYDWTFWGDDDMLVSQGDVLAALNYARQHGLDVMNLAAVPGKMDSQTLAGELTEADLKEDGSKVIHFGPKGRHYRASAIGFGLVFVHRRVFQKLIDEKLAERCAVAWGKPGDEPLMGWEFFPSGVHVGQTVELPNGHTVRGMAGEDYGFSELCRRAGIPLHIVTKFRTFHLHVYPYTWEDAYTQAKRWGPLSVLMERP